MSPPRETVYLVDGSGYLFRAFHALPSLTNSKGEPVNAVFGFTRMLVKLLADAKPRFVAIAFDMPGKTFRDELFEQYKANRPEAPPELASQIPLVHRVVESFGIPRLTLPGYEADDVLGTLAHKAVQAGFDVVIVTGDKDFMQLVSQRITLWDTMRDRRIGPAEVKERFGVEPRQVVEIMALTGDPIDNIKGVPGVGEKTASALIRKFGSVENLLSRIDEVEAMTELRGAKRVARLIAEHRADLLLARRLVELDLKVPIDFDPDRLSFDGIDREAALSLMRELEFRSIVAELERAAPKSASPEPSANDVRQVTAGELQEVSRQLGSQLRLSIHLVLDGSKKAPELELPRHVLEITTDEARCATYVFNREMVAGLGAVLQAERPTKGCHDARRHYRMMRELGISLQGVEFDTMLAGFLVNPNRPEPTLEDLWRHHARLPATSTGKTASAQVAALWDTLESALEAAELTPLFRQIELPLTRVLADMEDAGLLVDRQVLEATAAEFRQQLEQLSEEIFRLAGRRFNPNSPAQLRNVLFEELKLPTKGLKRTKSGISTDSDNLMRLAAEHPLPSVLLRHRALSKLLSTYVEALPALINPATGRIHTTFHQALTATGRLSSSNPNLQNIPARTEEGLRIRRAFVVPPGYTLLSADYSQIELRILAHLSGDKTLIEAFRQGEDIHARTASEVLGLSPDKLDANARRVAKVINFGLIYGMGPQRLSNELGISLREAQEYIDRYFSRMPAVKDYFRRTLEEARQRGYVTTIFGRRRPLPELNSTSGAARAQAERIAINTPIQGTAADLIKIAMVRIARELQSARGKARMLLQVHDELLFEVAEEEVSRVGELVRSTMEKAAELAVPLRADLKRGANWADLAPFD